MTKILSIILLIFLVNCTTINTSNNNEKPKSSIDTVIEAFKRIPFPNM